MKKAMNISNAESVVVPEGPKGCGSLPNLRSACGDSFVNKSSSNLLKRKSIFEGLPGTAEASIKLQTLILAILNSI